MKQENDNFVPHGSTCEADESFPDCVARCGQAAVGLVSDTDGRDHYVCAAHWKLWHEGKRGAVRERERSA